MSSAESLFCIKISFTIHISGCHIALKGAASVFVNKVKKVFTSICKVWKVFEKYLQGLKSVWKVFSRFEKCLKSVCKVCLVCSSSVKADDCKVLQSVCCKVLQMFAAECLQAADGCKVLQQLNIALSQPPRLRLVKVTSSIEIEIFFTQILSLKVWSRSLRQRKIEIFFLPK